MGDPRRFKVFAEYISRHYGAGLRIADVAGGRQGHLNRALIDRGHDVVTVDPDFRGGKELSVYGRRDRWEMMMARSFDLVVAMHPDQATEELVYTAIVKPVVIVPCCRHWEGRQMRGTQTLQGTIRKYFGTTGIPYKEEYLPMGGANRVFRTPYEFTVSRSVHTGLQP
jgi:hypothetical protein